MVLSFVKLLLHCNFLSPFVRCENLKFKRSKQNIPKIKCNQWNLSVKQKGAFCVLLILQKKTQRDKKTIKTCIKHIVWRWIIAAAFAPPVTSLWSPIQNPYQLANRKCTSPPHFISRPKGFPPHTNPLHPAGNRKACISLLVETNPSIVKRTSFSFWLCTPEIAKSCIFPRTFDICPFAQRHTYIFLLLHFLVIFSLFCRFFFTSNLHFYCWIFCGSFLIKIGVQKDFFQIPHEIPKVFFEC